MLERALGASLDGAGSGDEIRDRVLDAAAELFGRSGIRRTSIEDVARRAGVSRITVYRRFPTKNVLVEEVLLRDLRAFLVSFRAVVGRAESAAERLVEGFCLALRTARVNPLFGGLIEVEPEVILPFLTTDGGAFLRAVSDFIAMQLRREQEAGEISGEVDINIVAEVLARMTLSFCLTPESQLDLDDPEQARTFARCFLAPLVTGVGSAGDQ
ncbi:TetR/AcrR family transcriptional regulator [Frankia sp. CH37]|nr:TetR/AcrR family transcriptional regulator [Parafrankia sp. CH37]